MKLLIITQKVDSSDPILGFFHRWIEEFAKNTEKLTVICLEKGTYNLPSNTRVISLGKESGASRIKYIWNFYSCIWQQRRNYDAVFVHMNPEYAVLGGWLWFLLRKKTALWYVHKQVNLKLWLAEKFANVIFTSAPESFKLKSKKVRYVGHGIDTDIFKFEPRSFDGSKPFLYVGRITRIKNIDIAIRASQGKSLKIVGMSVTEDDKKYEKELKELAHELGVRVDWLGSRPNREMPEIYSQAELSINAVPDGGMDKAVLESLAVGCPAFTSNNAFRGVYGAYADRFIFNYRNSKDLADKIEEFRNEDKKEEIVLYLSNQVRRPYDISSLIIKIANELF